MATPRLAEHILDGALGEILVDVRSAAPGAGGPAIVIVHGFKGFKDWGFFPLLADRLARAGYSAVSYNASGSGVDNEGAFTRPERFGRNTFSAEIADLGVVLDAVDDGRLGLARPATVGLIGHSRGGGMAVLVTPDRPRVSALVTWAAISTVERWSDEVKRVWRGSGELAIRNQRTGEVLPLYTDVLDDIEQNTHRLDIQAHARRVGVPWLIIHGAEDETVSLGEGKRLAATQPAAEFRVIPGAGHTFGATHPLAGRPPALDELLDVTVGFFTRCLP
jgi:dienelactone hydrolase